MNEWQSVRLSVRPDERMTCQMINFLCKRQFWVLAPGILSFIDRKQKGQTALTTSNHKFLRLGQNGFMRYTHQCGISGCGRL